MSTPTRTPRKAGAPKRDRQKQGVIVAPEKVDDPKAERVLWDLASQTEGLGGLKSVDGDWLKNPLRWPEGFVIEIDKWRTTAPIRWKVYEKSKRTHGKGVEFWLNERKIIDAENNITASLVDHGGLGGLTDDDHTQYARTDGSRAITGTQVFNEDIKLKPTKRIYFDDTTLTSFISEVSDDLIRIATASTAVADFDSTGLQLQQNLKFLSGTSFSATLDHAITANRVFTYPDESMIMAGRNVAQTFTADQEIAAANAILQLRDTASPVDGKRWWMQATTAFVAAGRSQLVFRAANDAQSAAPTTISIVRNGTTFIGLGVGLDDPDEMLDVAGNIRFKGAAATYDITLTHAATVSNKTITLPDATTTLAGLSVAQTFTALQSFDANVRIKSSAGGYATLQNATTATDRTITLPNATTGLAGLTVGTTQIFTGGIAFDVAPRVKSTAGAFYVDLSNAATADRVATFPDATGTIPYLSLAQTFTAKQDIITASGTALQVGTTNTSGDMVFGELTGATGYNAFGLQGSLTFGTGAVAQANFYSSTADPGLYINNRLNSDILLRIDNVNAIRIAGTNRAVTFSGDVDITRADAIFQLQDTASPVDGKRWWMQSTAAFVAAGRSQLVFRASNDAQSSAPTAISIVRNGTTFIGLGIGLDDPDEMLDVAGNIRFKGAASTYDVTLTHAATVSNKTVTIPDSTTTLAGLATAQTFSAVQTFSARAEHSADIALAATNKVRLDGIAGTGDTYISESSANMIGFVAGASTTMRMNNNGVEIGSESGITAALNLGGSTTARASLRIYSGTAPTSPNDGDIWYDGTDINVRVGVTTKKLAYQA